MKTRLNVLAGFVGSMLSVVCVLGASTTFTYDPRGNLREVLLPNGTQIEYLVDGNDRRIGKKVNGVFVKGFVYQNMLNPIAELDGSSNIVSRFIYATRLNVPDFMICNGTNYQILTDHLGSPRMIVNTNNGTIVQRIDYNEFGVVIADSNPGFQPFGFVGGLYDPDTKLVRFGARDYDPQAGRFTDRDPIGFNGGQANLYAYVASDPVNLIDPSGLGPVIVDRRGDRRRDLAFRGGDRLRRRDFPSDDRSQAPIRRWFDLANRSLMEASCRASSSVQFDQSSDLHTMPHEAAHTSQRRAMLNNLSKMVNSSLAPHTGGSAAGQIDGSVLQAVQPLLQR